jgi:hypothetical protein
MIPPVLEKDLAGRSRRGPEAGQAEKRHQGGLARNQSVMAPVVEGRNESEDLEHVPVSLAA